MRLRHYWAAGGIVDFDVDTGKVRRRLSKAALPDAWGFVWKQRGRWFCLWHDGQCLVLQHRQKQWRLNTEVELRVTGKFRRTFRIMRQGQEEFRFAYWFRGTIFAHIDPTYDALDEESDDFFIYVTGMWNSWKDRSADEFLGLVESSEP